MSKEDEEMITCEVQQDDIEVQGVDREEGDLVDIPKNSEEFDILTSSGLIETTDKNTAAEKSSKNENEDEEVEDLGEGKETEENSKLKSWAKSSNWLSADDVEKGDIITILSEHEMQEYEGNESPIIEVEHQKVQANLRLNKQNTENIAGEFGWDSNEWIGKQIKVVSIVHYKGVDADGMILEPHNNS